MKRIVVTIFTFFTLVAAGTTVSAQDHSSPQIEVSTEKASIDGKIFLIHKVVGKQTVYSICKAYGITQDELISANPSLADGLKSGSVIFIPTGETQSAAKTVIDDRNTEYQGDEVVQHRVKWYETLKMISSKYGVPERNILEYNNVSKIEKGMILQIPMRLYTESEGIALDEQSEEDVENDDIRSKILPSFSDTDPVELSLIIPLDAGKTPSVNYFDFYCGALLALQEQKESGKSVKLNVFDLNAYSNPQQIIDKKEFQESDIIIGPVDAKDIVPFARAAGDAGIPFVSPMDQKASYLAENNPFFFQVPASIEIQRYNLIKSLDYKSSDKVKLFYNSSLSEKAYVDDIKSILSREGIPYEEVSYDILHGRTIIESLLKKMGSEHYKVIIASEEEAFASDAIRNMRLLRHANVPVEVFCSNKVRNFETIDTESMYDVSAHISAPYFVDYSDERTKDFIMKYRALFNTEPTAYSYQGHDIVSFFTEALYRLGVDITDFADEIQAQMIQCNIRFEKSSSESGWHNAATRDIIYNPVDYTISLSNGNNQD